MASGTSSRFRLLPLLILAIVATLPFIISTKAGATFFTWAVGLLMPLAVAELFLFDRERSRLAAWIDIVYGRLTSLMSETKTVGRMEAISIVVNAKRRDHAITTVVLVLALLIYHGATVYLQQTASTIVVSVFAAAIVVINCATLALSYRVRRGLYGTTEYEAREIIAFVLAEANDLDLSGGLGARDIDLSPEAEPLALAEWQGASA